MMKILENNGTAKIGFGHHGTTIVFLKHTALNHDIIEWPML